MNTIKLTLLTALLLVPLAALHAADAPISHRVLCTDYKGNRVVILSAKGDIEWEFSAKTPQDCWLLPNGNMLFSQITGAPRLVPRNDNDEREWRKVEMHREGNTFAPLDFKDFIPAADNPLAKAADGKPAGLEPKALR